MTFEEERSHRIIRRGIPYGNPEKNEEKGLLFLCYQADIANQYEFIQRVWCSNSHFPFTGLGGDPLIGSRGVGVGDTDPVWPVGKDEKGCRAGFGKCVHLQGGDYYYAISMAGLRSII